jgi:hypothetical protein
MRFANCPRPHANPPGGPAIRGPYACTPSEPRPPHKPTPANPSEPGIHASPSASHDPPSTLQPTRATRDRRPYADQPKLIRVPRAYAGRPEEARDERPYVDQPELTRDPPDVRRSPGEPGTDRLTPASSSEPGIHTTGTPTCSGGAEIARCAPVAHLSSGPRRDANLLGRPTPVRRPVRAVGRG